MTLRLIQDIRRPALAVALALAAAAGGCASESGNFFSTGSITEPAALSKVALDPACTTLSSQIEALRKEGTVERLEKAADGKTATVNIQRASLSKQAQLNKANADFISKCGPNPSKSTVAAVAAPAVVAAPAKAAAAVAKSAAAAKELGATGVTSAVPTATAATAAAKAAAPKE